MLQQGRESVSRMMDWWLQCMAWDHRRIVCMEGGQNMEGKILYRKDLHVLEDVAFGRHQS